MKTTTGLENCILSDSMWTVYTCFGDSIPIVCGLCGSFAGGFAETCSVAEGWLYPPWFFQNARKLVSYSADESIRPITNSSDLREDMLNCWPPI